MAPIKGDVAWPALPDLEEPAPPEERRAWGKLSHAERYRRQRRDLVRAAGRIASRQGYEGTRVADIVAEAGLSKSTFYEHFSSKEDCFIELYRRTSAGMLRAGIEAAKATEDDGPLETIHAVIRALVGYVERDPRLAEVMRTELGPKRSDVRKQRAENQRRIVQLFTTLARRHGSALDDHELEMTARVLVSGVTQLIPELERDPDRLDEELQTIAGIGCRGLGFDDRA